MDKTSAMSSMMSDQDKVSSSNGDTSARGSEQRKSAPKEGPVAKAIETQTSKIPSDVFLWLAGASIAGSSILKVVDFVRLSSKERKGSLSVFVGLWAPTFLLLGLYNKLVKVAGSDRVSQKP